MVNLSLSEHFIFLSRNMVQKRDRNDSIQAYCLPMRATANVCVHNQATKMRHSRMRTRSICFVGFSCGTKTSASGSFFFPFFFVPSIYFPRRHIFFSLRSQFHCCGHLHFCGQFPCFTHTHTHTHTHTQTHTCLLYTSPSPRDQLSSRMPSSA